MRSDEQFRKRVVTSAAAYSMNLYRAATELAPERKEAFRRNVIKAASKPKSKARKAEDHWARARSQSPVQRETAIKTNAMIRDSILKVLKKGPAKLGEIRSRLDEPAKKAIHSSGHLSNMMTRLKQDNAIKRQKGSKRHQTIWMLTN